MKLTSHDSLIINQRLGVQIFNKQGELINYSNRIILEELFIDDLVGINRAGVCEAKPRLIKLCKEILQKEIL